jgi:hypothetical protein
MTTQTFGAHYRGRATPTDFASVIGWQEAEGRACRKRVRHLEGMAHYPPRSESGGRLGPGRNTISWRRKVWRKVGAGYELAAHGGMFGRLPLYLVWVRLEHRETGVQVVVINTHWPNGAWAAEDGRASRPYTARRRREWRAYRKALRRRVRKAKRHGREVVVLGDTNRHQWGVLPGVVEAGRTTAHRPGYDRIGSTLELVGVEHLSGKGSDHRRIRARYHIGRGDHRG